MDNSDTAKLDKPIGALTLRTTAMPADTNYNGDIFGGWIMSQMDLAGAIACLDVERSRFVTVAVKSMRFWNPVHTGDVVCVYCKLSSIGKSSVSFHINVWAKSRLSDEDHVLVTEAEYIYVKIEHSGKSALLDPEKVKAALNKNIKLFLV
ncbi:MAG TPA: acyl-CoA thioesterase [Lentisphaeria bacterium]|nr:MAG: hypothetical protein A2X47_02290 [Lentisphaerae bacterium GWF2_38_69]HBM16732.1 acyl-CoA thioesterase [Lentisphaeria bacterium]